MNPSVPHDQMRLDLLQRIKSHTDDDQEASAAEIVHVDAEW
jgi:hypothetical protein